MKVRERESDTGEEGKKRGKIRKIIERKRVRKRERVGGVERERDRKKER